MSAATVNSVVEKRMAKLTGEVSRLDDGDRSGEWSAVIGG